MRPIGYGRGWGTPVKGFLGDRERRQNGHTLEGRRGLGFSVRVAKARPNNAAIRELMGNDAYAEAGPLFPERQT